MLKVVPFIYDDKDDLCANTYLVFDDNKNCIVIDPSVATSKLGDYIKKNKLKLKAIVLTHTHFDHMRGVDILANRYRCKLFVGVDDIIGLTDTTYNCSKSDNIYVETEAYPIAEKEELFLLNEKFEVIYTPFHTMGSLCLYFKDSKIIFTGDTLFKHGIGRSDLESSNKRLIRDSLAKLKSLPDDVKVYPGHGEFTTIGDEKNVNLFIRN